MVCVLLPAKCHHAEEVIDCSCKTTCHTRGRETDATHVASAPIVVTSDAIARRAYEIFVEHGSPHGHDLKHWLAAERELSEGA